MAAKRHKKRKSLLCFFAAIVWVLPAVAASAAETSWQSLWNGRDLSEWTTWMRRPEPTSVVEGLAKGPDGRYTEPIGANRDPLRVFTVVAVDGRPAIRISGEVFGELRSKAAAGNYHLRFQFKWGEKKWPPRVNAARDSGLLYHVHAEPGAQGRVWARSIELQIQEKDVGDLYAVGSSIFVRAKLRPGTGTPNAKAIFDYDPAGTWLPFSQEAGQDGRCVKQSDHEKPPGEWNTVEVVCLGADAIHVVNGRVVMRLHGPMRIDTSVPQPVTSGPIAFQSEGAEIFYRDIAWRPITAIPPEFRP
jgi:hypothetical protein